MNGGGEGGSTGASAGDCTCLILKIFAMSSCAAVVFCTATAGALLLHGSLSDAKFAVRAPPAIQLFQVASGFAGQIAVVCLSGQAAAAIAARRSSPRGSVGGEIRARSAIRQDPAT